MYILERLGADLHVQVDELPDRLERIGVIAGFRGIVDWSQ